MIEMNTTETTEKRSLNFIEQAVENDLKEGKNGNRVQTRFPPEPNGTYTLDTPKPFAWTLE